MSGVFAEWQPAWAEAGVPTFPVDGAVKKPKVGNFLKGGLPASRQWALKFPEVNALGFACGGHSGITVVDIDEANDNLVADTFAKLGPSPVVVQTASGKFHAYYRFNGESRSVRLAARKLGLSGPVDILGVGGFALGPPSIGTKGSYRFIQGSLCDLAKLPAIRHPQLNPANDTTPPTIQPEAAESEGRNDKLFHACLAAAPSCGSHSALLDFARSLNGSGQWSAPLPADEVERVVGSAWKIQIEDRNGLAGARYVQLHHGELEVLDTNPDAQYLFTFLKRHHWGRKFVIANALADNLPCGSWTVRRFRAARNFLIANGLVFEVRPPIKGVGPALFAFSSPDAASQGRQGGGV